MSEFILALDQGTTSSRAMLVSTRRHDQSGRAKALSSNLPLPWLGGARSERDLDLAGIRCR